MVRLRVVVGAVAVLLSVVEPGGATAAAAGGAPGLGTVAPFLRGRDFTVFGHDLAPGASYLLVTDGGVFAGSGMSSIEITGDVDGFAQTSLTGTNTLPATRPGVHLELEDATGDTVLDSTYVAFAAPVVNTQLCPGLSAPVQAWGLPDGAFTLSSSQVSFDPAQVQVSGGQYTTTAAAQPNLPATFEITATDADDASVSFTSAVTRPSPWVQPVDRANWTPWQVHYQADCLSPGESVRQVNHTSDSTGVPATVGTHGVAHLTVDLHPGRQPRAADRVTFEGAVSGQTMQIGAEVLGTTLPAGHSLGSTGDAYGKGYLLAAASADTSAAGQPNYIFSGGCDPAVGILYPDHSGSTVWKALPEYRNGTCKLTLTQRGDLVLRTSTGTLLWTSKTRGTSSGNRLVMRSDGSAVIYTATNARIWATPWGKIATPAHAVLNRGATLTRGQDRSRGDVKFMLTERGNVVVSRAGTTVWSTHTAGRGGTRLTLTEGGVLILRTARGKTIWTSHTHATTAHLTVTPSGDVGIYTARGKRLWHTSTGI